MTHFCHSTIDLAVPHNGSHRMCQAVVGGRGALMETTGIYDADRRRGCRMAAHCGATCPEKLVTEQRALINYLKARRAGDLFHLNSF